MEGLIFGILQYIILARLIIRLTVLDHGLSFSLTTVNLFFVSADCLLILC